MRKLNKLEGRTSWNKGVYGEKTRNFIEGKPNLCNKHGLHLDWVYYKKGNSCVCRLCRNERSKNYQSLPDNRLKNIYKDAKQHAKQKGRLFNISFDEMVNEFNSQKGICKISGIEFTEGRGLYGYSLDRKDSSIGYTKENIQFLCVIVNRMKTDLPQEEFINICRNIVNYNNNE